MKYSCWNNLRHLLTCLGVCLLSCVTPVSAAPTASDATFRIGWISPMTGPASKYSAHQSAELAVEDVNAEGGILGRRLELIMEDGKCDGMATSSAATKLINVDKARYILGGHCSTETLVLAPLAERAKVLTLASISNSPDITKAGDYIFRTSPPSTRQSEMLAEYLRDTLNIRTLAIVNEDAAFTVPIVKRLSERFREKGGTITVSEGFEPGSTDFRSILTKIKARKPEALFIATMAQESAYQLLRQIRELNIQVPLFGNENAGNAVSVKPDAKEVFEGLIFGEARFDLNNPATASFVQRFEQRFHTTGLPYGIWTADAYDGVRLLAKTINQCGDDVESVKKCLYQVRDYPGISGTFSIDSNGDALREHGLKQVRDGRIVELASK